MLIYRLENHKGNGPFSASQGMAYELVSHADPDTPRMLDSAGIDKETFDKITGGGAVFGWSTLSQMQEFFRNPSRASLRASEMKMKVSVYQSDIHFQFVDGQLLFWREHADLIDRVSLRDFFNK